MKSVYALVISLLLLVFWASSPARGENTKSRKVPNNIEILQKLQDTWRGVACTGKLEVSMGEDSAPMVAAPIAVAFQDNTLKWTAFISPPTPCAGSVILGGVKVGLGNKPDLLVGTPPGMIIGNQPATLTWRKLERSAEESVSSNLNNLCAGQGGDNSEIFSAFAGGLSHRPDTRSWDTDHPEWLKLEGETRSTDDTVTGRYTVWLDTSKGFLPVRSMRVPLEGAAVVTTFEPREVSPGRWLPIRWKVSGAARATMFGQFTNLQCEKELPPGWFEKETYPDVGSQAPIISRITTH